MQEQVVLKKDLEMLVSESSTDLNMVLVSMISLMEENYDNISLIQKQNWFQRMARTISGKNRMTEEEIIQNREKIGLYISQVMNSLLEMNCIDHKLILGLGNKINELYSYQIETRIFIEDFAKKINQKIESIDNFHMLIEEINQNVYNPQYPFLAISKIMSQLDLRTVKDRRKMSILVRSLEQKKILNDEDVLFTKMLEELLLVNENEAGVLAIFFGNIRDEYIAEIAEDTICAYYMIPEKDRRRQNRHFLVEDMLRDNEIDLLYMVSSSFMCETLINAYVDDIVEIEMEKQKSEEEEKQEIVEKYIDDSMKLLTLIKDMPQNWEVHNGELNTHKSRKRYSEFLMSIVDNINPNSYIGNGIITNLNNITFFAQNIFSKYSELRINKIKNKDAELFSKVLCEVFGGNYNEDDTWMKVNMNAALEIGNQYQTVVEYYNKIIHDRFESSEVVERYGLEFMDNASDSFPEDIFYSFEIHFMNMKWYVALFQKLFSTVSERLKDLEFLNTVYNLTRRFPVEYNDEYQEKLVRETENIDSAYIEIEEDINGKIKKKVGYKNIDLKYGETKTILLRFKNMNLKQYTVCYKKVKDGYWIGCDYYKGYVDVEWGEWRKDNELEVKLTPCIQPSCGSGELKLKFYIKQDPDITACIKNS